MTAPGLAEVLSLRLQAQRAVFDDLQAMFTLLLANQHPDANGDLKTRIDAAIGSVSTTRERMLSRGAESAWQAWADEVGDAAPLVTEIVQMLMMQLVRDSRLDDVAFGVAEALLAELSRTAGVVPVSISHSPDVESIDHLRSTATVAMRFPGSRIWAVPILVHEFGHHLVRHLRHREPALADRRPLRDVVDAMARIDPQVPVAHAHEFVADAVATVLLGRTYPVTCLYLRVPPSFDATPMRGVSHPAWSRRVVAMAEVLRVIARETGMHRFESDRATVVDPLATAVLGRLDAVRPAEQEMAEGVVRAILDHRPQLVYRDADTALALARQLDGEDGPPPQGRTIRAVVDAAWRWRLTHLGDVDEAGATETAARWSREIVREAENA